VQDATPVREIDDKISALMLLVGLFVQNLRFHLFDGENISFDAHLVIYIYKQY
jgi:hypothetical protein